MKDFFNLEEQMNQCDGCRRGLPIYDLNIHAESPDSYPYMGCTKRRYEKPIKKIVNMPIEVPNSDYCWDGKTTCTYYDSEGGHSTCELDFHPINRDQKGRCVKPEKCKMLNIGDQNHE